MKINSIIILISICIFLSCNNHQPERHENIPKKAKWYGGADGGSWIIIEEGITTNTFLVKVYTDYDGQLIADKLYRIDDNCSELIFSKDEVIKDITSFSGDIILNTIVNGKYCSLIPYE